MSLLRVSGLQLQFRVERETVYALRDVALTIGAGTRTAIVGESGSGKTALTLALLRLLPPNAQLAGSIRFRDQELLTLSEADMQQIRGAQIAMIFQHAQAALNPLIPIGRQIADVCRQHSGVSRQEAWERAVEVLAATGIQQAAARARDYPHQYSGGMAQRALIAMALVCEPQLLIADEPTSGLDVAVQQQVLALVEQVVAQLDATLLLITHDLAVVAATCDHIIVMYAGEVMETGTTEQVLERPANPYTAALLACFEQTDEVRMPFIPGRTPDMRQPLTGCSFAARCPMVRERCRQERPLLTEVEPGHFSSCHFAQEVIGS